MPSAGKLQGIYTPNIVPLNARGEIHEGELRRYVDWLIAKGVHGLYPNGSTGEFTRFTVEERIRIMEIICHQVRGRVPVLAGAAEANVKETVRACEKYFEMGATAVAIVAPYYYKLSPLYGWGLQGYMVHANDPELVVFASESTRASPGRGSLFHSEFTTNAVAYGLLGIIYTLLIFFVPLTLCIRQWARGVNPRLCAFGIVYLLCEIVSGLSTEIFGLKFAASFHAVFLACICAELLSNRSQQQVSTA